jgi:ABC-type sugar transport system substrate-binding protein
MKLELHWATPVLTLTIVAAVLTACATSPSGGGNSGASGGQVTDVAKTAFHEITGQTALEGPTSVDQLQTRVASYTSVPKSLLQTKPLSKPVAQGKTMAVIVTDVPVLAEFYKAISGAAAEIGWKVERIDQGATPQGFPQAYDRAIQLKPDLVVGSGLPRDYFDKQLTQLAQMNIPVIEWSSGIAPVEGKLWTAVDDPLYQTSGMQLSEFVAADSNMAAKVVAYNVPQYKMPAVMLDTMSKYLPTTCKGCSFDAQDAGVSDVGQLGSKVTGYVQSHPDTNYVLCGFGDLCTGVGQALKAAGLANVKVVTRDGSSTNFGAIKSGSEFGTTGLSITQTGWQIVDLAQRIVNGDDTSLTRLAPQQIVTKISDPSSPLIGAVPDFKTQYRTLWLLPKTGTP